jgi:hypothetical protein
LDDIVERARSDRAFREALFMDAESTLDKAGYDPDPGLVEAVREHLSP